jgi:ABC-type lipoprotein release transport system permease subunit
VTAVLLVFRLAVRSLVAHRVKSLLVGGLLFLGTLVVVLGSALFDSVEDGMQGLVTESLAGQFQVKQAHTKDPLALFGGGGLGTVDIGEIERFEDVEQTFGQIPGVKAVVPMGLTGATVFGRNEIDSVLVAMRDAIREGKREELPLLVSRARRIVEALAQESATSVVKSDAEKVRSTQEAIARASDPAFWAAFEGDGDALSALDFLDSRIAPLATDGRLLYLQIVGTDPEQFVATFPRFKLVQGTTIPEGKPGFLFNESTYQELVKNRVAAELDKLRTEVEKEGASIDADPLLQQRVRLLSHQYRRITFQLDPAEAATLEGELRGLLLDVTGDLDDLVSAFLTVDDSNLAARHDWFYAHIAPLIPMYDSPVGGTITLRGFTRTGYIKAVEVPVYGTYIFDGLQDAGLQSGSNIVDLVTFRELYGKMSDRDRAELGEIKAAVGVADISRADAEAALFGGGGDVEVAVDAPATMGVDIAKVAASDPRSRSFPPEDLRHGLVLNAAIVLDDPSRAAAIRPALEQAAAGMGLEVVGWREASGFLGQIVTVLRIVLLVSVAIIFVVALIIVNNAMLMATLDRVPEIGTLRAIGTQRGTVLGLLLLETGVLGAVFGGAGGALAAVVVTWLHGVGIPAPVKQLAVMFGGPRLYPVVGIDDLLFGVATIVFVALASTLYPAAVAARVPPIVAMRGQK